MSDYLITPRGTSTAAAAAAALSSGFYIASRARPYVEEIVTGVKRAYGSLRDYRQVQYGPGSGRFRRERQLVKKRLRFEEPPKVVKSSVPVGGKTEMSNSVQFTRYSDRIGRKKRRTAAELFNAEIGRMTEVVYRWQQVSESLLGPGENILAYGLDGTVPGQTGYVVPIMVASLTNNILFPDSQSFGCQRRGLHRLTYNSSTKNFGYQYMRSQDDNGAFTTSEWLPETGAGRALTAPISSRVFHKWTEIRLNLYGSAYYPLTYEVMVVTGMETDMSVFDFAAGGQPIFQTTNLNAFLRDQTKDYIGNPIVGSVLDRQDFKDKFKVIRRQIVKVDPLSYSDGAAQPDIAAGQGVDASNVKNINMFIRHDRFREYGWTPISNDQDLQNTLDGTGYDKQDTSTSALTSGYADVDRSERVYLFIKCTAPRILTSEQFETEPAEAPVAQLSSSAIPAFSGSYDIVMRNCFRYSVNA